MHEPDDHTLLRQYAEQNSESAFAALVARHLDKVYSTALRHTRNIHAAEEITQAVFVILAKKSGRLGAKVILAGWLYETARLTAVTFIRSEIRRARREQEAHMQTALNENDSEAWPHIAPLLDDALAGLSAADRHAIVLRYFDGKSLGEVGAALGASEDAAKKRVTRAVEKLRGWFTKRGVTLTATVLTAAISANSVQAAPLGLAATVTATAVKGAAVSGSTLTLIKGALKIMACTKAKTAIVVGVGAVLVGTSVYQAQKVARLREQNQTLQQAQAPLLAQVEQLGQAVTDATNRIMGLSDELASTKKNNLELLKLRGEVGVLRAQLAYASNPRKLPEQPLLATAREYYNRADRHQRNHEYEAQLEDLNKAIELDPNMADAYMERGNLYSMNLPEEKGGDEKAVADYTRCLEIKPDDFSSRWNRANHYRSLGKPDLAIADWTIIIQGDVDFSRQLEGKTKSIARALVWRGLIYQQNKKDYSRAISDYTAAIQMNPNAEYAHRSRGECYEKLGEAEKAQQDFAIEPKSN